MSETTDGARTGARSVLEMSRSWPWLLLAAGWLILALDGDLFWDEPGYLYIAAYVTGPEFFAGTFQPSEIENFYLAKILHLMFVKALVSLLGPGALTLAVIVTLYSMLTLASVVCMHAVVKRLLPGDPHLAAAAALTALTPVVLYIAFKTLPEAPALFLVCAGLLAYIRSLEQPPLRWIMLAAVSIAAVALLRHSLVIMIAGFVITAFVFPPPGIDRAVVVNRAVVTAALSLVAWVAMLWSIGISVQDFLLATSLFGKVEPFMFKLSMVAAEFGVLWLIVVIALWSPRRRALAFFLTWFLLTTLPKPLLFSHIEPRYQIPNLPAFAGLAALALGVLRPWADRVSAWRPPLRTIVVAALLSVLFVTNWIVLRISPAELNMWQVRSLMADIRADYVGRDYALLTSWTGTDFHYLRFVYPDLPVFNASGKHLLVQDEKLVQEDAEDRYFQGRRIRTMDDLDALPGQLVYFGYDETFMVANARRGLEALPGITAERYLPRGNFMNHLAQSWMWGHRELTFELVRERGHYLAFEVRR